jgi:UDP-2,3-diacylglucosamine pyrophosphatase LpxH
MDLEYSYNRIYDTMMSYFEDREFLKKLYTYCKSHANTNAYLVKNVIDGLEFEYNEKSQLVSDICESMMIRYNAGERIYNYKGIRDLGMFIFNFDKLKKIETQKNEDEKTLFKPYEGQQLSFIKK